MTQSIREFLNLDANDEIHMFLTGTKKITPQMKYDVFVKNSLEKLRPVMVEYLTKCADEFKECITISQIEDKKMAALPEGIKELILTLVDKQKHLNLVEQTYMALDLFRAVSGELGTRIGKMAMHYANAINLAPTIVKPNGESF